MSRNVQLRGAELAKFFADEDEDTVGMDLPNTCLTLKALGNALPNNAHLVESHLNVRDLLACNNKVVIVVIGRTVEDVRTKRSVYVGGGVKLDMRIECGC